MITIVTGTLFLSNAVTTSGVGSLSSDVKAGDVYWYDITSFPSFQSIIDTFGVNDEGGDTTIAVSGGIEGSRIYAKVLGTHLENMDYWDGSNMVTAVVPTVDLSIGMITGSPITVDLNVNGTITTTIIPAGIGLPLPVIFGTTTYFNVSYVQEVLLPVPLFLNDDYATHETQFTQLATQIGGGGSLTVINDASQFRVDADLTMDENATVDVIGFASWAKTNGMLQELNFEFYNTSTSQTIFDIDIDLDVDAKVNTPVAVEVGDTFSYTITDASFGFDTSGFPPEEDFPGVLTSIQNNFTAYEGMTVAEFEVIEVDQMYYRVTGEIYNETDGSTFTIPDAGNEIWMVGFGKIGPGMPMNMLIGSDFGDDGGDDGGDGGGDPGLGLNTFLSADEVRLHVSPGFVTSKDYDIYSAWDKTMNYVVSVGATTFLEGFEQAVGDMDMENPFDIRIFSSTTDEPVFVAGMSGGETADGGYSSDLSISWDVGIWQNETTWEYSYDEFGYETKTAVGYRGLEVNTTGAFSFETAYDSTGAHDFASFDGYINVEVRGFNENGTEGTGEISISDFILKIDGSMTRVNPIITDDDTTTTTTTTPADDDTTDDEPLIDLPGFELVSAVLAFSFVTMVIRRRKA